MPRPIQAIVHVEALRHNLDVAKRRAGGRAVWAVAKADAYGHGIEQAVAAFGAADGLAVLDLAEAARARAAGWTRPILLLEGFFEAADLEAVVRLGLATVVHCDTQLALLERSRPGGRVAVHLKCNSGMNRLGFEPSRFAAALARAASMPHVEVAAAMTHLANADARVAEPASPSVREQIDRFAEATRDYRGPRSIANSAALMLQPSVGGESVRPGIVLYGGAPCAATPASDLGLLPAMSLRSRLLEVRDVPSGATVGYGGRWQARRPSRIGVVACGYADGYPRHAPDGTPVAVAGRVVPLAGRVSMDMLTVDLTGIADAAVGAEVELWGRTVAVDEVAQRAGTIGYELLCAVAPRVARSVA